jgi:hypothetical protein
MSAMRAAHLERWAYMQITSPPRRIPRLHLRFVGLALSVLVLACVTRTRQYTFEVKRGATIEERIEAAKPIVTAVRLERLKLKLKERYPELTDGHLDHFGVRWNEHWTIASDGGKANRSVTITVIMEERAEIDTAKVVESAARILDAEINGPDHSAFGEIVKCCGSAA